MPGFPLVELHTHLEGALTPRMLISLARKYGRTDLLAGCLTKDGQRYRCDDFAGFLQLFKGITLCLRSPADYHALALLLGEMLRDDQVVYCECAVAYGVLQKRGLDPEPIQCALADAAAEIRDRWGVTLRWIPDAVRQFGVDAARRAFAVAARAGRGLGVVGFGLGGDEGVAPPEPFAPLFAEVAAEGLGVTVHAGEMAGPESVRGAVEACGAARIGHGLSAARNPAVMDLLAERHVFVELCPGSNIRTGAVASWSDYPLRAFLALGIACCLNTDDRALFDLDLRSQYAQASEACGLTTLEQRAMQRAALDASFADSATRAAVAMRLEL